MRSVPMLLVTLALGVAPILAGDAEATTYVVRPDGTGDFPTIQTAINDPLVVDGDIIELTNGTFTGPGNRDIHYAGKAIEIRSQGGDPSVCIIDCEASLFDRHRGFFFHELEGPASILRDIMIVGGYAPLDHEGDWGGGILCERSSPTIQGCRVVNNQAGWGGGILCIEDANAAILNCTIEGNSAFENGGGIYCTVRSDARLEGLLIRANWSAGKGGGLVCNQCSPLVQNCTFVTNIGYGAAVWVLGALAAPTFERSLVATNDGFVSFLCETGGAAFLRCCDLYGNAGGDGCASDQIGQNDNFSEDPLFCGADNPEAPWTLCENSPCTEENSPCGQRIGARGIGCGTCGPTPTRDASWGMVKASFRTLSD